MKEKAFDRILARTPDSTKRNVSLSMDIALRIHDIMESQGITQKDLADLLKKNESEISKWLTGMHNFTLSSIIKLEIALGEPIIEVIGYSDDRFSKSTKRSKKAIEKTPDFYYHVSSQVAVLEVKTFDNLNMLTGEFNNIDYKKSIRKYLTEVTKADEGTKANIKENKVEYSK